MFWNSNNNLPKKLTDSKLFKDFSLEERIGKRLKLEEKYPKDGFSLIVVEGLDKF
jgi:hypothetical protein